MAYRKRPLLASVSAAAANWRSRKHWSAVLRRAKDGVRLLGSGEIKTSVAFSVWGASKSATHSMRTAIVTK